MTTPAIFPPEQGQLVQARSRPWVVNGVKPSKLPASPLRSPFDRPQHLLTLASVEDDGLGEELQVIYGVDFEAIESVAVQRRRADSTERERRRERERRNGRETTTRR